MLFLRTQSRCPQHFARGQCRTDGDASVDTDNFPGTGARYWRWYGGESNMPAASAIQRHPVGLRGRDVARPAEPDPSGLGHQHLARLAAEPTHMARLDRNDPEALIPASLAPRRLTVRTCDKARHRPGEVPKRLLLHHLTAFGPPAMLSTNDRELRTLHVIAGSGAAAGTPPHLLLNGEVPQPGMGPMLPHHLLLGGRGHQAVAGHAKTLSIPNDTLRDRA
jgi:hypothetical protein